MNMEQLLLAGSEGQDLKRQRGPAVHWGRRDPNARSHSPLCTTHMAHTDIDKTSYRMNNSDLAVNTQSFHLMI